MQDRHHRWVNKRNPEGGVHYLECERCQKQKDTITIGDISGSGSGSTGPAGNVQCPGCR